MWIAETIDLDDHDSVVRFMKNQSDKIKKLEKENERLKQENKEFKALLDEMSDRNNEIWLDDGTIYRLRKVFKGKWRRVDGQTM